MFLVLRAVVRRLRVEPVEAQAVTFRLPVWHQRLPVLQALAVLVVPQLVRLSVPLELSVLLMVGQEAAWFGRFAVLLLLAPRQRSQVLRVVLVSLQMAAAFAVVAPVVQGRRLVFRWLVLRRKLPVLQALATVREAL